MAVAATLAWRYYLQAHETRLDPLALESQPLGDSPVGSLDVLLVGDSRMADWPPLDCPGMRSVLNDGIAGHTSAQTLGRLRERLAVTKPRVVVVETCINDLKTIPFWLARRASIVDACKRHVTEMVRLARTVDARVVLLTVIPAAGSPVIGQHGVIAESNDILQNAVGEVNKHIRSLAADNVLVLPAHELLGGKGQQVSWAYARDSLHLNAAGYFVLGTALCRTLAQLLPAN
jgi:lysophospholipase L1-like esterase